MNLSEVFLKKINQLIGKQFFKPLLAVSGGADSMSLSHLCYSHGISFGIAHCNFSLRGEESDADEQLIKKWADEREISFFNVRFDTKKIAEEWSKGIQETARELRYAWLETIRANHHFSHILTAHHANDNVETLLMNLFKGTGMSGLHGIPERNNYIIRPILFAAKSDIELYVTLENIPYREDASNASDKYLRNAIRHHVIPSAASFFPHLVRQVSESIERFKQAEILYRIEMNRRMKKLCEQRGNELFVHAQKWHDSEVAAALCFEIFSPFNFSPDQMPQLLSLALKQSGKYVESKTHRVVKDRKFLIVSPLKTSDAGFVLIQEETDQIEIEGASIQFSFSLKPTDISTDQNIALIDKSKISFPLILRHWRQGDYFYPLGMGMKKKKLKRFFIDQKIPLHNKENVWVVESEKRIVWVVGYRLDERFKLRDSTSESLRIELRMK
ncbi:MAG: tRNA lysidine(34) synthetase TilS [Bacteroidetes bacterium]|nr:tRNA lysidine(34) synthetase TilS [Bacteroidota bacterium]